MFLMPGARAARRNSGRAIIKGTATNDNAPTGYIGEYVSSTVLLGAAVAITASVGITITSILLAPGDWDVWANAGFTGGVGTMVKTLNVSLSLVNNTRDTTDGRIFKQTYGTTGIALFAEDNQTVTAGPARFSFAATTRVYCVANTDFATSTLSGFGILQARRRR